jgi:opine dehydrogenase
MSIFTLDVLVPVPLTSRKIICSQTPWARYDLVRGRALSSPPWQHARRTQNMRLTVVGAGPVGLGTAILAQSCGHAASIWSPSGSIDGQRHSHMEVSGALEGEFSLTIGADAAAALSSAEVIMFAAPANAHRSLIDAVIPHLVTDQIVILWTQSSLSSLYLSKRLAERRLAVSIALWTGPVIGGRRAGDRHVRINTIRPVIEIAALPHRAQDRVMASCSQLFGARFTRCRAIDVVFANVNPVMHLPQVLCNLTRIEHGESWSVLGRTTASVARLIEALDEERLHTAAAFGAQVITLSQFLERSFPGLPLAAMSEQALVLAQRLQGGAEGPKSLETRFVNEDVPYGAVPVVALAQIAGVPTPAHRAFVDLFELLLGRNLRNENGMLEQIALARRSKSELMDLLVHGWEG